MVSKRRQGSTRANVRALGAAAGRTAAVVLVLGRLLASAVGEGALSIGGLDGAVLGLGRLIVADHQYVLSHTATQYTDHDGR